MFPGHTASSASDTPCRALLPRCSPQTLEEAEAQLADPEAYAAARLAAGLSGAASGETHYASAGDDGTLVRGPRQGRVTVPPAAGGEAAAGAPEEAPAQPEDMWGRKIQEEAAGGGVLAGMPSPTSTLQSRYCSSTPTPSAGFKCRHGGCQGSRPACHSIRKQAPCTIHPNLAA